MPGCRVVSTMQQTAVFLHRQGCMLRVLLCMQIIAGSSIQFNCSDMQNTTNSMPPKTAAFCSGLSAAYYSQWAVRALFCNVLHITVFVFAGMLKYAVHAITMLKACCIVVSCGMSSF